MSGEHAGDAGSDEPVDGSVESVSDGEAPQHSPHSDDLGRAGSDRDGPGESPAVADSEPLRVEELHVRRAPGFEHEELRLDSLSPGVTVVHGPNASGKTTAAQAIQWLLWPDAAPDDVEVEGRFALGGEPWRVRVDRGRATYWCDGREAERPSLPPADQRDRYSLALHDLLQHEVDGADLAAVIERESAGGYDLDAAYDALDFDDTPSTRGKREVERAEQALAAWRDAREELREVGAERDRLPRLERELEDARSAQQRADLLAQAIEYAEARDDLAAAEDALEGFPDVLSSLDGDEHERVRELADEIAEWERRRDAADDDRETAERELATLDLPADGLPEGVLDGLRDRRDDLERLEDRERQLQREFAEAEERLASALEDVPFAAPELTLDGTRDDRADGAPGIDEQTGAAGATVPDLDPETWPDLWSFARTADAVAAERRLEEAVERWLGEDAADVPDAEPATLRRGRQALEQWLASPAPATEGATGGARRADGTAGAAAARRVALVAAATVATVGVVAGGLVNPALFALVLVAAGLAAYGWYATAGDGDGGDDRRQTYREDFQQLPLEPPAEWTEPAVRDRLLELYDGLAAHEIEATRADTRERLLEASRHERRAADLEDARERLREDLGTAPEGTDLELVVAARALVRYQEWAAEVAGTREQLAELREQAADIRAALADDLAPYGFDAPDDAAAATECVSALEDRARKHEDALERRERASETLERAEEQLASLREERDAVFRTAGLEPGEHDRLRERCERVAEHEDARRDRERARSVAEKERSDLRSMPGYEPDLEERDVTDLREERREASKRAERVEELQRERSDLEARVDAAKRDAAVETARAEADRALDDLEALFEADAAAAVGDVLVEHCRDTAVDASRPAVFERARDLLARITHGRYRLDLDADRGAFRAYDAVAERDFALEELSSGTQLQVLLAVRIAFVEHQERGRALPLCLDETLANSDDQRARVVVEAVLELVRAGRQVLYCTAQGDEVATWRAALDVPADEPHANVEFDAGVPAAEIDLAEHRGLDERVSVPALDSVATGASSPPDPAEHDHASYRDALDVPPFDPRRGAGSAHCWYLLEDPAALADCLALGVRRWGQVATLLEQGLGDVLADDPEVRATLERRGRALETFVECWVHGRGDRVTRDALEATDAVTETFLEDVTELARAVDGDAQRIVEELRDGAVDRFRSSKIEELEAYFESEGHLDPAEPLSPAEIRVRVIGTLVDSGIERERAAEEADALFERIDCAGGTDSGGRAGP